MVINGYSAVSQAVLHFFVGFGFALLNLIIRYFAGWFPQVISVLRRRRVLRAIIFAYLIALVIQMLTSPLFASVFHSKYVEFAWSPFEAFFNVLGVIAMDLLIGAWLAIRRGAEVGGKQLHQVKERASQELGELGERVGVTGDARANRQQAEATAEAQAEAERKRRINDQLKDY